MVRAEFVGDSTYAASSATGDLTVRTANNNDVRSRHGRHVNLCDVCPVYARPSDMHSVG